MTRFELVTSSLPRKRSTPELHRRSMKSERETRFELATFSLEGWRSTNWATPACFQMYCGESRIRTCEGVHQQIYSLPSLAAWVSPQHWEPMEGFEPPTSWLQISCSGQLSYIGLFIWMLVIHILWKNVPLNLRFGIANVRNFFLSQRVFEKISSMPKKSRFHWQGFKYEICLLLFQCSIKESWWPSLATSLQTIALTAVVPFLQNWATTYF